MNEDILGGLKSAVERGESLKKAMMTFFNSGYKREEIEEAAKIINGLGIQQVASVPPITQVAPLAVSNVKPLTSKQTEPVSPPEYTPSPMQESAPVPPSAIKQKVSNYGEDSETNPLVFVLVGVLVFLLGILISIFIFKDELISFFSSFFA